MTYCWSGHPIRLKRARHLTKLLIPTNPFQPAVKSNFKIPYSTHHSQKHLIAHPIPNPGCSKQNSPSRLGIHQSEIHMPSTTCVPHTRPSPLLASDSSAYLAVTPANHTAASSPSRPNPVVVPCSLHVISHEPAKPYIEKSKPNHRPRHRQRWGSGSGPKANKRRGFTGRNHHMAWFEVRPYLILAR
ncbi:hypothetical protein N657DRAFT_473411 [Parathielavia appendiculata]|uniref:Uncharacterized protein n=1 Tax=Parathielavia appendiculata TaxID=2587402 RepID=A0AAN6TXM7_9PEZI|nr:hypothetical protein N657DRAFT_473411 [Parathielavia appendiculata]